MSLRNQISPLLEDFKRANGKGSSANANLALTKIIETLLSHIEHHISPPAHGYTVPHLQSTVFVPAPTVYAPTYNEDYVPHFGCLPPELSLGPTGLIGPIGPTCAAAVEMEVVPKVIEKPAKPLLEAEPPLTVNLTKMAGPNYEAPVEKPTKKRPGPKPKKLSELKQPHRANKGLARPLG